VSEVRSIEECCWDVHRRAGGRCEAKKKKFVDNQLVTINCPEVTGTLAVTYKGRVTLTAIKVKKGAETDPAAYLALCWNCQKKYIPALRKLNQKKKPVTDEDQLDFFI